MDIGKNRMLVGLGVFNLMASSYFIYRMYKRYQAKNDSNPLKLEKKGSKKSNKKQIQKIFRICLTGNDQKTISQSIEGLKTQLQEKGYKVYLIPNLHAMTDESGVINDVDLLDDLQKVKFIIQKVNYQISFEDYFTELAVLANKPSVILCNGGVMDSAGLVNDQIWQLVNDQMGWNNIHLRDGRYDQVLLISNDFHNQQSLQNAWTGHPQYSLINCDQNNQDNIDQSIKLIMKTIGMPVSNSIFKKFLIKDFNLPEDIKKQTFQVDEVFLRSKDNQELKVRKRGVNGSYNYVISKRMLDQSQDQRNEIKRQISAQEYLNLIEQKSDQTRQLVKKERIQFIYNSVTFNIDIVKNTDSQIKLLRYQSENKIELPFVEIEREVTRNLHQYISNHIQI